MDSKQFHARLRVIRLLVAVLVVGLFWALWQLQVVNGAYYLNQSVRKITNTETVEAARGEILDRYGRVLVSNRTTYQVSLNTSVMGKEASRNPNLLALLEICREEDVAWPDTLPISAAPPFVFTLDTASEGAAANFDTLVGKMGGWQAAREQGADALVAKMREFFRVDESVSPEEGRALIGLLYELRLRSMDIVRTSYLFAQDVDIDFISKVKERGLVGVEIKAATVRQYHTAYAAHLLGRVGLMDGTEWTRYKDLGYAMDDTVGKDGVEQAFEADLRGEAGVRDYETDTSGRVVSESWRLDGETGEELAPKPGDNVVLTLDICLQEVLERSLADTVAQLPSENTQGAAGVVIDIHNGGVLAMASYPTFDLANVYSDAALYREVSNDPLQPLLNRATQGTYSPGSTFKMVTAVAGLEEGIITTTDKILDTGVYRYYEDYTPTCWIWDRTRQRTHGAQNVTQALLNSCNVFFYDVGRRVGIQRLNDYAASFGLGQTSGLELYELSGAMDSPEYTQSLGIPWYGGLTLQVAIGQANSNFTPLQLANYIATLCNGGSLYRTHLLKTVKSSDCSEVIREYQPQMRSQLELKDVNLQAVKNGMLEVGNKYFSDLGVTVGAKTGTAQTGSSNSDALFVCFAPFDDPEIAIALVVEKGGNGRELAGVAADVMEYYFHAERTLEAAVEENTLVR